MSTMPASTVGVATEASENETPGASTATDCSCNSVSCSPCCCGDSGASLVSAAEPAVGSGSRSSPSSAVSSAVLSASAGFGVASRSSGPDPVFCFCFFLFVFCFELELFVFFLAFLVLFFLLAVVVATSAAVLSVFGTATVFCDGASGVLVAAGVYFPLARCLFPLCLLFLPCSASLSLPEEAVAELAPSPSSAIAPITLVGVSEGSTSSSASRSPFSADCGTSGSSSTACWASGPVLCPSSSTSLAVSTGSCPT
mmetsp:Transcript_11610/g.35474  ORF Transcript_11610/g.35474 Transcript_11610/m.35474 type:complete len:255 (-) Transcript_11610:731-1495(-)